MKIIIKKLKEASFINDSNKVSPWIMKKINDDLKHELLQETNFLEYDAPLSDRIKILLMNINYQPKCVCGNIVKYEKTKNNFLNYCSLSCGSKYTTEKKLNTIEKKYGKREFFSNITKEQKTINAKNATIKSKEKMLEIYGVTNPMDISYIKEKHSAIMKCPSIQNKRISTRSKTLKEYVYDTNDLKEYKKAVWHYTRHSNYKSLPNVEKRGKSGIEGAYQLDHKISIFEGFVKKIDPKIIGSIENLQFIPWEENLKKGCVFSETININSRNNLNKK